MANKKKKTATTNTGAKSKEQLVIHQIVVKAPQRKVYESSFMTCLMIS